MRSFRSVGAYSVEALLFVSLFACLIGIRLRPDLYLDWISPFLDSLRLTREIPLLSAAGVRPGREAIYAFMLAGLSLLALAPRRMDPSPSAEVMPAAESPLRSAGMLSLAGVTLVATFVSIRALSPGYVWIPGCLWVLSVVLVLKRFQLVPIPRPVLSGKLGFYLLLVLLGYLFLIVRFSTSWRFIAIGDEYDFYWTALRLARDFSLAQALSPGGVYGDHPFFLSYLQSLVMSLLSPSQLSFRLSATFMVLACIPPLIGALRTLCDRYTSASTPVLLGSLLVFLLSEPILVWSMTGKPHAAFLIPVAWTLPVTLRLLRSPSTRDIALCGTISGLGLFFSALGALSALALSTIALVIGVIATRTSEDRGLRRLALGALFLASSCAVCAAPLLGDPSYFTHLFTKNIGNVATPFDPLSILLRSIRAISTIIWHRASHHFLFGNVYDLFTSLLLITGIVGAVRSRSREGAFLLVGVAVLAIISGGIGYDPFTSVTRTHLLVPLFALLIPFSVNGLTLPRSHHWPPFWICITASILVTPMKFLHFNPYQGLATPSQHFAMELQERGGSRNLLVIDNREDHGFFEMLTRIPGSVPSTVIFRASGCDGESTQELLASRYDVVLVTNHVALKCIEDLKDRYPSLSIVEPYIAPWRVARELRLMPITPIRWAYSWFGIFEEAHVPWENTQK